MHSASISRLWLMALAAVAFLPGCERSGSEDRGETGVVTEDQTGTTATRGKIPLTTRSEEARALYDEGLALFDQLRFHDAREKFEQAAAKDPDFAMAQYYLALNSPSEKAIREHLDKAVALSESASPGERLAILAFQAANNAQPAKSLEYAEELVEKYPRDERARLNLGFTHFVQQDYSDAAEELQEAIDIDSSFSPAYNMLGYSYRFLGKNEEAERAFKKYIELVPEDPNPYDSYAEFLMKTGQFDQSIAQYRKALSIDPHFMGSYFGISSNLMFQGKHAAAIAEAEKMERAARNDGERRFALFTKTVVYADQGKTDQALKEMQKQYDLGAKIGDTTAMASDAVSMGNIVLNAGRPDRAKKYYQQAMDIQEKSSLSPEVKDDARLVHHFNLGRVALKKNDVATAKREAAAYLKGAEAGKNEAHLRQAHELAGMIALEEKESDQAISELGQADQQDPHVLYLLALAHRGKGDQAKAAEMFKQAAESYTLPTLSYAFIRAKAKQARS